jgi:hypothetical protein
MERARCEEAMDVAGAMFVFVDYSMKQQLRMFLSDPVELGVHIAGPTLLARGDEAAVGLRAVYAHTWGLEIEIRMSVTSQPPMRPFDSPNKHGESVASYLVHPPLPGNRPPDLVPSDPFEHLQFGLGWESDSVKLHSMPRLSYEDAPHDGPPWFMASRGGSGGHLSCDAVVRSSPCPLGRTLWLGWAWPELGLPTRTLAIDLPSRQDIYSSVVTMRAKPDEASAPPEVIEQLKRISTAVTT